MKQTLNILIQNYLSLIYAGLGHDVRVSGVRRLTSFTNHLNTTRYEN